MLVLLHDVGVAIPPLKVTVLLLCVTAKANPVSVTEVPTGPDVGLMAATNGGGRIVKGIPLLVTWVA
jgi:hypothetical protein